MHSQLDSAEQKIYFPKSHGGKKWKFLIGLDARRSFFSGVPVKLNGLKLGAEFRGVHRFGFGFYWLKRNVVFTDVNVAREDADPDTQVKFDLGYSSLFYERVFFKNRWWEIAFPFHLGGGNIKGTYRDTIGAYQPLYNRPFSCIASSVQVKFYPLEWLALRVSGGYRLTFNAQQEVKDAFNRPFYGFGLSINIIELYRVVFKKNNNVKKPSSENNNEEIR